MGDMLGKQTPGEMNGRCTTVHGGSRKLCSLTTPIHLNGACGGQVPEGLGPLMLFALLKMGSNFNKEKELQR